MPHCSGTSESSLVEVQIIEVNSGRNRLIKCVAAFASFLLFCFVLRELRLHAKADTLEHERQPRGGRQRIALTGLAEEMGHFPIDPHDYNERRWWAGKNEAANQVSHNYFNGLLFAGSAVVALVLAQWHRRRRADAQQRENTVFWVWTVASGMMAICWCMYIFKLKEENTYAQTLKYSPLLRFYLAMAAIMIGSMALLVAMWGNKYSRRRAAAMEWRERRQRSSVRDLNYTMVHMMKSRKPPRE